MPSCTSAEKNLNLSVTHVKPEKFIYSLAIMIYSTIVSVSVVEITFDAYR
jgi:hypothetical protein